MDRYGHQVAGLNLGLATAVGVGMNPVQGGAFALITAAFSGGKLSPDADQRWKRLDRWIPDEALGHGGPLGHRRLSHWWGLPALAALAIWWAHVNVPAAGYVTWIGWAVCLAWVGHDAADWAFGLGHAPHVDTVPDRVAAAVTGGRRQSWTGRDGRARVTLRPAGVPLMPWWCYSGLGLFHSGGKANKVVTVCGHFTALPWAWLLLTGGGI